MTIDMLKEFGANTEAGLKTCMGREDFYLRMVNMIPGDANFQKLFDAMDAQDPVAAFEAAHALKGSAGNLALTPIYEPACTLTELLRGRTGNDCSDCLELAAAIRSAYEKLVRICAS